VLDDGRAKVGVVADPVTAYPGIYQGKREEKNAAEPELRLSAKRACDGAVRFFRAVDQRSPSAFPKLWSDARWVAVKLELQRAGESLERREL
jgi:hypothetical protein